VANLGEHNSNGTVTSASALGPCQISDISVIVPVCLQVPKAFQELTQAVRSFCRPHVAQIIILCNRLKTMDADDLRKTLRKEAGRDIIVVHDMERSVAGAWNRGIEMSLANGIDAFIITAFDVLFTDDTVDTLIRFGNNNAVEIWSSTARYISSGETRPACDFSCFMLRRETIQNHGWFDKEYKPAYFEDNDYVTRVVLGGGTPRQVLAARHIHKGSMTIKLDAEMAHHVRHWYALNAGRFTRKWKAKTDNYVDIARVCFQTPYNSGKPLSWWPEQDRKGYSPSGGIHQ